MHRYHLSSNKLSFGPNVLTGHFLTVCGSCVVLQVAEVSHLDDEIMALHSEIVELQRSPYARRQGDKMEQLLVFIVTHRRQNWSDMDTGNAAAVAEH